MKRIKRAKFVALILSLVLGLALIGCTKKTAVVKIGVILPLTGSSARLGELQLGGVKYAVDYVNNKLGGIKSLNGAKIVLVIADSTGNAELGMSEAERLINSENIDGLIGTYNSSVCAAVVPVCEKYGVPMAICNSTSDSILEADLRYCARTNQSDTGNALCYASFIKAINALGVADEVKKFAIIHESTDWGVSVNQKYGNAIKDAGYEVVLSESFETGVADFSAIVNKIKNADVDAILPAMYVSDANLFVQQLAEYDVNVPLIAAGGGMLVDEFIDTLGDYAEFILTINGWSLDTLASKPEKMQGYIKEYTELCQKEYGSLPNENVANGWLAAMVLFEAIDRAGTTDKDSVAAELLATDLPADDIALLFHPYPGVKFGQLLNMKNQNIYASPCITQVIDGNMRQVFDGSNLITDVLVYPQPSFDDRGL